jgi:hypothetical protein
MNRGGTAAQGRTAMAYADQAELAVRQEQADEAFNLFNRSAPRAMDGETVESYRRRMASRIQEYAPNMKDVNVRDARGSAFDLIEKQIYEDAKREAHRPTMIPDGELREVTRYDVTGRPSYEFFGRPRCWMDDFANGTKKRVVGIKQDPSARYTLTR